MPSCYHSTGVALGKGLLVGVSESAMESPSAQRAPRGVRGGSADVPVGSGVS